MSISLTGSVGATGRTDFRLTNPGLGSLRGASVCLVGMHFAPETTGNAPYTTAMAEALQSAGARVHVVTGVPHYPQWRVTDQRYRRGLRWRERHGQVRVTRLRHAVPRVPDLAGRARMEASFLSLAAPVVARDDSQVIIAVTPMLSALTAATLGRRGRPLGVLVQDLTGNAASQSGTTRGGAAGRIARIEYGLLRGADAVGVIAPRFGEVLASSGVREAAIWHLPNFTRISPSFAAPEAARERLGWPQDRLLAVHTGNMGMKQGLENVIAAARIAAVAAPEVLFVLVGDGSQRGLLQRAAAGLSNVRFVDPLDEADYPLALAAADVLLLQERPSATDMSLPSKLTSYTAASRPIVAAVPTGGATASLLRPSGAAELVAPDDPAGLVRAVQGVCSSGARRAALVAAAARLNAATYGREAGARRYVEFAVALLERRSGASG